MAAAVFDDAQVTPSVITTVLPSSRVPVATNDCVSPEAMDTVDGVTSIDFRFASVTATVVAPLMDPEVAVIEAVPDDSPVTSPALPTVATEVSEDAHVALLVSVFVLPSL